MIREENFFGGVFSDTFTPTKKLFIFGADLNTLATTFFLVFRASMAI